MNDNTIPFYLRTLGFVDAYEGPTGATLYREVKGNPLSDLERFLAFPPREFPSEKSNLFLTFYARTFGCFLTMQGVRGPVLVPMPPLPLSEEETEGFIEQIRRIDLKLSESETGTSGTECKMAVLSSPEVPKGLWKRTKRFLKTHPL